MCDVCECGVIVCVHVWWVYVCVVYAWRVCGLDGMCMCRGVLQGVGLLCSVCGLYRDMGGVCGVCVYGGRGVYLWFVYSYGWCVWYMVCMGLGCKCGVWMECCMHVYVCVGCLYMCVSMHMCGWCVWYVVCVGVCGMYIVCVFVVYVVCVCGGVRV